MGAILMRGLDQKTIERLKERARLNGRTLQQEAKALLERGAETLTMREARRVSERTGVGAMEAPARWTVDFRQRAIDPRGSRFALSVAVGVYLR
jgi:hypothetical protein